MDLALPAAAPAGLAPRHARTAARAPARVRAQPWTLLLVALAGMLLTYVWRLQDLFPVLGKGKPAILSSLAALGLVWISAAPGAVGRTRHPVFRWAAVLLGLCVLSVPFGVWPGFSARFILEDHVKTFLLMALLVAAVRSVRDVERLIGVHVAGAALYCVMILTTFSVGADGRLGGLVYYDANDLAMLVVCTFPMVVYLTRPASAGVVRLAALGVMALFAVTILRTGSRGGFLGLLAVFGVMLWSFRAVPRAQRIGAVAVVALLLAVGGGSAFWEKMGTLLNPGDDYNWAGNNETGRLEVWKRGIGYMIQRPVLGVGANAFPMAEGMISPLASRQEMGQGLKWSAAHNSFVQVGAELGVPGLLAFLALLAAAFRVTLTLSRARAPDGVPAPHGALAQALTATLVGYCVSGFFLSQAYSAFLYSVLGLVTALGCVTAHPAGSPSAPASPRRPVGRGGLLVRPGPSVPS
jgi:putative inorganic carbon (HCO3(-)) transporter